MIINTKNLKPMVVGKNGMLLDEADIDSIQYLREIFITQCNLDDRKFAIMLLRMGKATDLVKAMDLTINIKETFTWID